MKTQELSSFHKLVVLGSLYMIQGLPFGFQSSGLSLMLRSFGMSLPMIGFSGLLNIPWILKPLWAPFIESLCPLNSYSPYSRWSKCIIPLQVTLVLLSIFCSFLIPSSSNTFSLFLFSVITLGINFITATMDIAVDGLAVDILLKEELGWGNAGQVIGFKAGMLVGGGFLMWITDSDWENVFRWMALIISLLCTPFLFTVSTQPERRGFREANEKENNENTDISSVVKILLEQLTNPAEVVNLAVILMYKAGEMVGDRMFKLFLFDSNISATDIGLLSSTYGISFSIAGSFFGGYLASKTTPTNALQMISFGCLFSQMLRLFIVQSEEMHGMIFLRAVVIVESLAGGAVTTAMFAFMMDLVDKRIGASHYTALAAIEVLGKSLPSLFSGLFVEMFGYDKVFLANVFFSVVFVLLALNLTEHHKTKRN